MKLKEGDIFKLRVSDASIAVGQILTISRESLTVIVFEGLYDKDATPDVSKLVQGEILLLANTFDAKFYHRHWVVFGNYPANLDTIKLPIYKLGTDDELRYEDFFQQPISASSLPVGQKGRVGYRNYVAPVRVEKAVRAFYKLTEWNDDYDKLLYQKLVKQ